MCSFSAHVALWLEVNFFFFLEKLNEGILEWNRAKEKGALKMCSVTAQHIALSKLFSFSVKGL